MRFIFLSKLFLQKNVYGKYKISPRFLFVIYLSCPYITSKSNKEVTKLVCIWIKLAQTMNWMKMNVFLLRYSRKKPNRWGRELRIKNFQGNWRNRKWNIHWLIKNNFKGWSRKTHVEFPEVLVLGFKISEECNTIL